MRKTRFKISPDYDFKLLGISSNVKGYRLAWEINQKLHISLVKAKDLVINFLDDQHLTVINFKFDTENGKLILLKNRGADNGSSGHQYLIPEHPEFDYFLWIKETDILDMKAIGKHLKDLRIIQYVVGIDPLQLKSKDNLLF